MPEPLSVCIITLNEEERIRPCLESVRWADEIVVLDSFQEFAKLWERRVVRGDEAT